MSFLIEAGTEAEGLSQLIELIIRSGQSRGDKIEIGNCLLSISFNPSSWKRYQALRDDHPVADELTALGGWSRATRVYTDPRDRPTKPSYLRRLQAYPDRHRRSQPSETSINQIDAIVSMLAKKPGYSLLSFIFLRPADLFDQFRPGYVPCPVAGDFKFRDGKLNLSVMFRTCDVLRVGYADIYYLRLLQQEVLDSAKRITTSASLKDGILGTLDMFFARAFIPKRVKQASHLRDGLSAARRLADACLDLR